MKRLVAVTLAAAIVAPGAASADIQPIVVVGHQVIDGGEHVWDQPIVITPGATLTVRNATVWLDWEPPVCTHGTIGYCHSNVMVNGGTLEVIDSTFDAHGWDVSESESGYTIVGTGAVFRFQRSLFQHYDTIGTQGVAAARSLVEDSTFRWAISGVTFWRGTEADILRNTFEDIMFGITVRDTAAVIRGNRLNRIKRHFATEPFGRAIDVQSTIVGEKLWDTVPVIEDNVIENGVQGMLNLNGFPNVVRRNVFRNNFIGAAIGLSGDDRTFNHHAPVWTNNVFTGNESALRVYVSGGPREGTASLVLPFHRNSFVGTRCTDISMLPLPARVELTVDANDNWWGTPDGPQNRSTLCPALDGGNIVVERWLSAPPEEAA